MSVIVSTSEQIVRDPSNKSKSKMLYSFTKSQRFPKNCNNMYLPSYQDVINSMKSARLPQSKRKWIEAPAWGMGKNMTSLSSMQFLIKDYRKHLLPGSITHKVFLKNPLKRKKATTLDLADKRLKSKDVSLKTLAQVLELMNSLQRDHWYHILCAENMEKSGILKIWNSLVLEHVKHFVTKTI